MALGLVQKRTVNRLIDLVSVDEGTDGSSSSNINASVRLATDYVIGRVVQTVIATAAGIPLSANHPSVAETAHAMRDLFQMSQAADKRPKMATAGVLSHLVKVLQAAAGAEQSPDMMEFCYDALRAVANVAQEPSVRALLVKEGAMDAVIALAASSDKRIRQHAVGALANLSLDSTKKYVVAVSHKSETCVVTVTGSPIYHSIAPSLQPSVVLSCCRLVVVCVSRRMF